MRSKKNRFTREGFDTFASNTQLQTTYNKLGTLKYISQGAQFGVVTSSKHEKRAVARNKLRRRIYTLSNAITTPFSGILYASKQSYTLPYDEIKLLFENLLSHATNHTT